MSFSARQSLRLVTMITALIAVVATAGCSSQDSGDTQSPGQYTVTVTLSGGSGKATIQSPTTLTISADQMTAEIVWSSPYYTWMDVDGTRYTPTSAQGEDSTFEVPVTLDTDISVTAETIAMSEPHEIDYTLHFDSSTLTKADGGTSLIASSHDLGLGQGKG